MTVHRAVDPSIVKKEFYQTLPTNNSLEATKVKVRRSHMISESEFNEQLASLGNVLSRLVEQKVTKTQSIEAIELRSEGNLKYCIIRTSVSDGSLNKENQYMVTCTISYHRSYQEPVLHFRVFDIGKENHYKEAFKVIDEDPDSFVENRSSSIESLKPIVDLERLINKNIIDSTHFNLDNAAQTISSSPNFTLEIPDIEMELKNSSSTALPNAYLMENITLDYHIVFQNQIWFFIHPCATNDVVPDSIQRQHYLLAWFSVYGRLLHFSLSSDILTKVVSTSI